MGIPYEDGGPAFGYGKDATHGSDYGMTLRDYFAAKAMAGMLAEDADAYTFTDLAAASYRAAAAMIEERKKHKTTIPKYQP